MIGKRNLKLKMLKEKKDIDENRNIIGEIKSSSMINAGGEEEFVIENEQRRIKVFDENRNIP